MLCVELPPECLQGLTVSIDAAIDADARKNAVFEALLRMDDGLHIPLDMQGDDVSFLHVPPQVVAQLKALSLPEDERIALRLGDVARQARVIEGGVHKNILATVTPAVLARKK